jgi:hypothetical protein
MRVWCFVLPLLSLPAQDAEQIRAAMEASLELQRAAVSERMPQPLERQRQSIRTQAAVVRPDVGNTGHPEAGFFTIPWPLPEEPAEGAPVAAARFDCRPLPVAEIQPIILASARETGVRPDLLREVIRQESNFRPCAVSPAGAQGLMQLMPATARELAVWDPFDPRQNIEGGARFLRQLLDRYGGDLRLALSAYNAGPAAVDKAAGAPGIPETRNYVLGILSRLVLGVN